MTNSNLKYLGKGKQFKFGAVKSEPAIFEVPDGRILVCLEDGKLPVGDVTRFGYRVYENTALLLGLLVSRRQRGIGMGSAVIDYALRHIEEREGLLFAGTGYIHKPGIALALTRAGLAPELGGAVVDILPRSSLYDDHIPNVHVLEACETPELVVCGSAAGPFYREIPTAEVKRHFPFHEPTNVVGIHTVYSVHPTCL